MSRKRIYQWCYHVHLELGSRTRISLCSITCGQFEFWNSTFFRNTNLIKVTYFKETVGQHVCWQHDIFVGSDVMAHKRFFYLPCYCKERSRISNCYGKEKALQDQEMKRENFQESQGNVQVGGSGTQVNHRLGFQLLHFFFFASEKNQYVWTGSLKS